MRSPRNTTLRWKLCLLLSPLLMCAPLFAIDRDLRIDQLYHTAWTHKDGAPTQIRTLAQTIDGFLWIGDATGLYRFDGVRFELYEPPSGQILPGIGVGVLLATPDGGLWIGFDFGPVSFLKDGKITTYLDHAGLTPYDFARDDQGVVWMSEGVHGLLRFTGTSWETIGLTWDFPGVAFLLFVDHQGTLWVSTGPGLIRLPKGARKFEKPEQFKFGWGPFAETGRGTLWTVEWSPPGAPNVRSWAGGPVLREFNIRARVYKMLADSQGSLWIGTGGHGINRTQYPERADGHDIQELGATADVFREKDGLSGDHVSALLEDRDGDVWAATNGGLDRFRQAPLSTVAFPSDTVGFSLSARDRGAVLAALKFAEDNVFEILDGKPKVLPRLPPVLCAYRDPDGSTWLGTQDYILHYANRKAEKISVPGPQHYAMSITKDRAGRLVALLVGSGTNRWENAQWINLAPLGLPPHGGLIVIADQAGSVWEGFSNNRVARIDGDQVTVFSSQDGVAVGDVRTVASRRGSAWIGGDRGLERFEGHRFVTLVSKDNQAFQDVTGFVVTAGDGIWMGEKRGIVHIPETETRRFEENPAYRVEYEVLDALDGLSDTLQPNQPQPNMVQGTDGRIWIATARGVVWLDPRRIPKAALPPPPSILSLTANGRRYRFPGLAALTLPPHTVNLQIAYTAASLAIPERARFRYRLDGQDKNWQDAGARREAIYTNLGPGSYSFRVSASNSQGIWNDSTTALAFVIQPVFYQTKWFPALCVCAGAGLLWLLYLVRLRQIAVAMNARFDERLAERTRIARDFHDTLLQTIQGSKMVADGALDQNTDPQRMRNALERLSGWLGQAIEEARSALHSLRTSTIEGNDLAEAFQRAGEECILERDIGFRVSVEGSGREMHPIVRDEVYRIGYEAIRNACVHSGASQVTVDLSYTGDLRLRVRDNGNGIDPDIAEKGKKGHFGLVGMYERAARIRGKFTLTSSPGQGTEVELVVPRSVVFQRTNPVRHTL